MHQGQLLLRLYITLTCTRFELHELRVFQSWEYRRQSLIIVSQVNVNQPVCLEDQDTYQDPNLLWPEDSSNKQ